MEVLSLASVGLGLEFKSSLSLQKQQDVAEYALKLSCISKKAPPPLFFNITLLSFLYSLSTEVQYKHKQDQCHKTLATVMKPS